MGSRCHPKSLEFPVRVSHRGFLPSVMFRRQEGTAVWHRKDLKQLEKQEFRRLFHHLLKCSIEFFVF